MKRALITGIRRIGFEVSKRLIDKGYSLVVVYKSSEERAKELFALAREKGSVVVPIRADLSDPDAYEGIVNTALEGLGGLDAFIHVAGPYYPTPLEELKREDVYHHFVPTTEAFLMLGRLIYRAMLSNPSELKGRIVAFGDWATNTTPYRHYSAYFISKGALHTAVKVLAKELAPHVLVNAIALGPTLKPDGFSEERWQEYIDKTPLRRAVSLKDVVSLTEFLLEVESMTGEIINLDSGRHVSGECT